MLSDLEMKMMAAIYGNDETAITNLGKEFGWLERREDGTLKNHLERFEFENKLKQLNISIPW
jgi:hypothetical protein